GEPTLIRSPAGEWHPTGTSRALRQGHTKILNTSCSARPLRRARIETCQGEVGMLLEKLCEYAERLDLPPTMYVKTAIRWLIDLDLQGNCYGFVPTEGRGGKRDRGKAMLAPHVLRTSSAIRAKVLADNAEYVLGVAREKSKPAQVVKCHVDFV